MQIPKKDPPSRIHKTLIWLLAFLVFAAMLLALVRSGVPHSEIPGPIKTIQQSTSQNQMTTSEPKVSPSEISETVSSSKGSAYRFFVSTEGDDSNPGTLNEPWKTINKAARVVKAGEIVFIRGGVYKEVIEITNSGTKDNPITFSAYPGKSVTIDGDNYDLPASDWTPLILISGDFIHISSLEVQYSKGMGVVLAGEYDIADNINSHHHTQNGILITGDYSTVQNSVVWSNCMSNFEEGSLDNWASGLSAARAPNHAVIRNNVVYGNWGEGLSTYEANGTIIEDNIVHDNWSANIYISDATNILLQRNFVYASGTMSGGSQVGIMMGDEKYKPASANIEVINNIVFGANRNFYWWRGTAGGGMNNVTIANNTFVNSTATAGVIIAVGKHQNMKFINNLTEQDGPLPIIQVNPNSEFTFSNNLWSKKPEFAASGPGDVLGNPEFLKMNTPFVPDWFRLNETSPARDKAIVLSNIELDFFGNTRELSPDIGAIEVLN